MDAAKRAVIADLSPRERAALEVVAAMAEAIRDLGRVPSGELYAHVMGALSLEAYQRVIATLVEAKLVKVSNYLIEWCGPAKGTD